MGNEDLRLLALARTGDEASFLTLWQQHKTPLFRFAWRLTGSVPVAEDITQECFLAVLQTGSFDESRGSLRAYLFGISRNLIRNRLRITAREDEDTTAADPGASDPLDGILLSERAGAVAHAVACLPPNQREAVTLFEYEEMSLEEIAAITGIDTNAVKSRLHRARETLRRRLAPLLGLPPDGEAHEARRTRSN